MSYDGKSNKKIYGSEAAFLWGRTVYTDYSTGCLRRILLRANGVREEIDSSHGIRGKWFEDAYEARLKSAGQKFEREVRLFHPTDVDPDISFSGRVDYVVDGAVHELKSTESKNKLRSLKSGVYTTENLAQTIAYMVAIGTDKGKLTYAYCEPGAASGDKYRIGYEKAFCVEIDEWGRILVDKRPVKFTVYDQLAHSTASACVIRDQTVWDRPANYSAPFNSPCTHCSFRDVCEAWDSGSIQNVDEFTEQAKRAMVARESNK